MATRPKLITPCGRRADLGFCNLYGRPFLKFTVSCHLAKGHAGKHEGLESVRVAPTYEGGDPLDAKSIESTPVTIKWADHG